MRMIQRIQIVECIAIILVIIGVIILTPINMNMLTHTLLAIFLIFLGISLFLVQQIEKKKRQIASEQLLDCIYQVNQLNQCIAFNEKNDPQTSLPNYEQFKEMCIQEIVNAKQHQKQFCMIFIDIDHFENVNETFGREIGDHLLIQLSERLNESFRTPNFVARIGD